jgi:hypothetical protein
LMVPDPNLVCEDDHGYKTYVLSRDPLVVYVEGFLSTGERRAIVELRYVAFSPLRSCYVFRLLFFPFSLFCLIGRGKKNGRRTWEDVFRCRDILLHGSALGRLHGRAGLIVDCMALRGCGFDVRCLLLSPLFRNIHARRIKPLPACLRAISYPAHSQAYSLFQCVFLSIHHPHTVIST